MTGLMYLICILLCRVVQAICGKRVSNNLNGVRHFALYTTFAESVSAVFALILLVIEGISVKPTLLSILIAVISGLSLFLCVFCSMFALKSGTVSAASMFGTAGMLLPLIFGMVFLDQPIKLLQWLGVVVFFVAAYLLISNSKKIYVTFSFKTMLLLIGNLVSNGLTMVMQQLYTQVSPEGSISLFSLVSFASASIFGWLFYIFGHRKTDEKSTSDQGTGEVKLTKVLIICGVSLAAAIFVINQFATICTSIYPPVILFTVINGGGTIISTVVAAIMYKEKITLKTASGVILGILGLVMVKLFA